MIDFVLENSIQEIFVDTFNENKIAYLKNIGYFYYLHEPAITGWSPIASQGFCQKFDRNFVKFVSDQNTGSKGPIFSVKAIANNADPKIGINIFSTRGFKNFITKNKRVLLRDSNHVGIGIVKEINEKLCFEDYCVESKYSFLFMGQASDEIDNLVGRKGKIKEVKVDFGYKGSTQDYWVVNFELVK